MPPVRRPTTGPETAGYGVLLGVVGGALTFAHYGQSVFPAALPTPTQLPVALLMACGVLLSALRFDMRSTTRIGLVSVPLSYVVFVSLEFAPQLLDGWSADQLFVYYVYGGGGTTIGKWLLFEPLPLVAGVVAFALYEDGPFS